ncbi:HNH endonuclease signature motif containing protein [Brachybacterium sp. p3-SID957]|uniref:HNH endonuclease signature motif containing protein n=1 Tax=Brachybacterium sp. p3-SID957 TaxID=2916049 RepID=UPI00223C5202|nr:HNH endonuclease signature motif containing protein [Brachybacterium sp. p3-SID957]MCT1774950.1 HNH endonuclease [Brachybacterium sp. p3-SID957]
MTQVSDGSVPKPRGRAVARSRPGAPRPRKPGIRGSRRPLTRETLPSEAFVDEAGAEAEKLRELWDLGLAESRQLAAKLRLAARHWPAGDPEDPDLRDEADLMVSQALRCSIHHASRLLEDAHTAVTHLPRLLARLEAAELPARWFTVVLRRAGGLREAALHELDESIASWELAVDEGRFRRELGALVRWLSDQQEAAQRSRPQRSVDILPPDEDGTACLQVIGPAPEILALGRRLDSAARAIQRAQRQALESGQEIPFDDGSVSGTARPLSLAALRYRVLTGSVLETGTVEVPRERFRITVTVPALSLLGAADAPGMLDGIHPIPAEMARELAGGENTWYRVLTDPSTGAFLPLPADRYTARPDMLEHLRLRHPTCAVPGCTRPTSWASEMDHIEEFDHRDPASGGPTSIENTHLLCWRHHQLKTAGLIDPVRRSAATADPLGSSPSDPPSGSPSDPPPRSPSDPPSRSPSDPPAKSRSGPPSGALHPGSTSWAIRGGPPVDAIDDTDMVTPWVVDAFTQMWDEVQQRIARHRTAMTDVETGESTEGTEEQYGPPPY